MLTALDLLRRLGWAIISFIYNLIDTLFEILKELNLYDIVDNISDNTIFSNFHSGIIAIALTLLGLFIIWRFVMKILDPDDGLSGGQIVKESIKCGLLILMSVFLFSQANTFAIKLSGYTSSIFSSNNITISDSMLEMYVNFTDGYKASDDFENEDISANIKNDNFTNKRMYNDKYVTSSRWILPDEKDYKYDVNWIMAIIVGGFFLYALFFSGMMLARRQIEFLFLFLISPIIFATSIGNKQRRSAVIEQLVSLVLQGAVVMLIIGITVLVMKSINETTFFSNNIQNMVLKSLMFIGCGTFLLTGSQVINRFIGANVSANSGREQLMSLMSYGHTASSVASVGAMATTGAGAFGLGAIVSGAGKVGGNKLMNKVGGAIQKFGSKLSSGGSSSSSNPIQSGIKSGIGNTIEKFGGKVKNATPSHLGSSMRNFGKQNMGNAINSVLPQRNMYRNRYRTRM